MQLKGMIAVIILVLVVLPVQVLAQQQPHYTQYVLNTFIINPAVAGIENYWDVKASHRHQWAGLNGSPVTTYLTVHGPLSKTDYPEASATGFNPEGSNPRGKAYWASYSAPASHAGAGLTILNDRTGPLNRFSISGTYAHHIGVAPGTSLSAGISVGAQRISLDASKLEFQNPADPAIAGSTVLGRWRPDVSVGLYLYSSQYFAGISAQNIVPSAIGFDNGKVVGENVYRGKLVPHLFGTAGYRLWVNEDLSLLPSVMIKYVTALPLSFDVNAKLQYQDRAWVGASYRHKDGIAAMLGINVNATFNVGYAYDYTTSGLNIASHGSHEIVIGIMIGNRFADLCPRNVW
ncbi:PorP/SprF family type IX secretion system membrane protein [Chitinophaga filiformis]|uniref:Type IX secretion system membrane protein, PorP/SprF family n=1 Tax=Chitinophaga filiformis TaxID=104663 RepID=A0A1G7WL23_CHIFI|nr:type IX secretion system membrane protein PorP/SprF [Chitinophaga filiformis]SDG72715.1 type IX secretion system membrane protein, PorP/SprF family [Chitinophaga filiformis]